MTKKKLDIATIVRYVKEDAFLVDVYSTSSPILRCLKEIDCEHCSINEPHCRMVRLNIDISNIYELKQFFL